MLPVQTQHWLQLQPVRSCRHLVSTLNRAARRLTLDGCIETICRCIGWIIGTVIFPCHCLCCICNSGFPDRETQERERGCRRHRQNIARVGERREVAARTSEEPSKNKSNSGQKHIAAVPALKKNPNRTWTKEEKKIIISALPSQ